MREGRINNGKNLREIQTSNTQQRNALSTEEENYYRTFSFGFKSV